MDEERDTLAPDDSNVVAIAQALKDVGIGEDAVAEELALEYGASSSDAERIAARVFGPTRFAAEHGGAIAHRDGQEGY